MINKVFSKFGNKEVFVSLAIDLFSAFALYTDVSTRGLDVMNVVQGFLLLKNSSETLKKCREEHDSEK